MSDDNATIDISNSDDVLSAEKEREGEFENFGDPEESGAADLLASLEQRQNEVLEQLAALDEEVCAILRSCGVTPEGEESDELETAQGQDADQKRDTDQESDSDSNTDSTGLPQAA